MTAHNDTGATARLWKIDPRPFRNHGLIHISNGEYIVAKALGQTVTCETEAEATAALIVEAVNAYEPLKARLAEVERERDDIRSTLNAWFNTSNKLEPDISKLMLDGLNGYIRRSESGGMPFELADDLRAVIEDFCRLYVGELLTPYIEQAKSSAEARVAELERDEKFWRNEAAISDVKLTLARDRIAVLEKAGRGILPYLRWTISDEEGPGHHPTMPSAVAAFEAALAAKQKEAGK